MQIPGPLVEGTFVRRENRFRATVEVYGQLAPAHVPNSGRLHELFVPGRRVLLRPARSPVRKTRYDLVMVDVEGRLVSLDARLPGPLVAESVREGRLVEFSDYTRVHEEVRLDDSRIDLLLAGDRGYCWVEAKSVTLVVESVALFPDAVTARGRRHVETLARAVQKGDCAAVVFVVQRDDARAFAPHDASDPAFGRALRMAAAAGVKVYAYTCDVAPTHIRIAQRIPVMLKGKGRVLSPRSTPKIFSTSPGPPHAPAP